MTPNQPQSMSCCSFGIHFAQQIDVFGSDEHRHAVDAVAAHFDADVHFFLAAGSGGTSSLIASTWSGVLSLGELRRRRTGRPGRRTKSCRSLMSGPSFTDFASLVTASLAEVVVDIVLLGIAVQRALAVAKAAAPLDQCSTGTPFTRHFRGDLRKIAIVS